MSIDELYQIYRNCSGVSTDTRSITRGNLFFALKGENFDANKFAQQALEAGASYAVIDNPAYAGERSLLVNDSLQTLQQLAQHHRKQLNIPVIGLTGSNGKTTTKELMAAVLQKKYKTAFTKGNLNNHIGVPLSLLAINDQHEMALIEMGANHQKEIGFLCSLCEPDYGYITNFGKAHLEGFGGIEGVIKGKSELYDFLRQHRAKAFVNADDPKQLEKSQGIETITFGQSEKVNYPVYLVDEPGSETVIVRFNNIKAVTRLTGTYNFSNVGAAIALGQYFDMSNSDIKNALESYLPQNNRSQIQQTERNKLVIDAYNANPSSMELALANFSLFQDEHKWAILGDMFELGEYSEEEHQKIAEQALSQELEKIILVGKEFGQCSFHSSNSKLIQFDSTQDLLKYLEGENLSGKTILLKGSRGMALEKAIALL